jgi:GAF domain-containing protein
MATDDSAQQSSGNLSPQELERLASLPGEAPVERIDHAVGMAREALGMEVAYLTEFEGEEQVYRAVAGSGSSFDITVGEGRALEGSYCERMITNRIPAVVTNSADNDELRDLSFTRVGNVASYVGVPVRLSDGSLYGTLCAVSHQPRTDIGPERVRLLEMLSRIVASGIEQERLQRENEQLKTQLSGLSFQLDEAEEDRRLSRILLSGEFTTLDG